MAPEAELATESSEPAAQSADSELQQAPSRRAAATFGAEELEPLAGEPAPAAAQTVSLPLGVLAGGPHGAPAVDERAKSHAAPATGPGKPGAAPPSVAALVAAPGLVVGSTRHNVGPALQLQVGGPGGSTLQVGGPGGSTLHVRRCRVVRLSAGEVVCLGDKEQGTPAHSTGWPLLRRCVRATGSARTHGEVHMHMHGEVHGEDAQLRPGRVAAAHQVMLQVWRAEAA